MLEKDPRARFQDHEELCAALEALLAGAEGDASWDVPLMDSEPSSPATVTEDPSANEPRDSEEARRGKRLERATLPLALAVALAALVVGALGLFHRPTPPPVTSARGEATTQAISVREVARPGKPPEAGRDTAPVGDSTPAPNPTTMPRQPKSRSQVEEKPAPRSRPESPRCVPVPQWLCTAAGVCSLALIGCPGAQMRPATVLPAPTIEPCPPDAVRTMEEKLGITLGNSTTVNLTGYPGTSTVRGGETVAVPMIDNLGHLPPRTTLYGQYIIGESRVYGRFTLARTPKGDTFPVCVQISDPGGEGTELVERGSGDTAKIPNAYFVQAVPRFANTADEIWRPKQNRPGAR
jgi:serine/threonine-protein kinase